MNSTEMQSADISVLLQGRHRQLLSPIFSTVHNYSFEFINKITKHDFKNQNRPLNYYRVPEIIKSPNVAL